MKIKNLILSYIVILLSLMSCQREELISNSGNLSFILTDGQATLKRSLPDLSAESAGLFTLSLQSKEKNETVFENTLSAFNASAPHLYEAGDYSIIASYGANPDLALDAPYYTSEIIPFTLEANKTKELMIPCFVGNSLASFKFGNQDELDKVLKDYYIEVVVGEQSVIWHPGNVENPYFKVGTAVNFFLKGVWISNDKEYSRNFATIHSAQKGKNYVYTLKIDVPSMTGVALDLQVETSVETVTVNETLPQEWLPKPKITTVGFDDSNTLTYAETADVTAQIVYKAVRPVEDVEFTLSFEDEQFVSLNKTYKMSVLTAEERIELETANFKLPVLNVTESTLDLSAMTVQLLAKNVGEVNNQIKTRVKANGRWSEEETYTVKTVKPDFAVSVYPGNIWTKEFTANTLTTEDVKAGNVSKISSDVLYQFSTDGNSWSDLASDLHVTELTPEATYYVRALYRGELVSNITEVKMYPQTALENGGLENATVLDGTSDSGSIRGSVFIWSDWATLNEWSTPSGITSYSFNSRSGCRPTDDAHNGKAVRVITLGYGVGAVAKPTTAMHSEFYLGTSPSSGESDKGYGIAWNSRPTKLGFWYKCISNKGNDTSLAKIQILHDEVVLGEKSFTTGAESAYQYKELIIDYSTDIEKMKLQPNKVLILFKSGTKEDLSTSDLVAFIKSDIWHTMDKTADATFRGNEFFVDDVALIYDK